MARCCGGKNAGKPITVPRYLAGLAVFATYHSVVAVGLRAAARVKPEISHVRDFHRTVFKDELKEVIRRDGINVGGWVEPVQIDEYCAIELPLFDDEAALETALEVAA
ncbi:MAG: hypothetical protein GY898_05310 [Proteobacteria bacterium]|nr:hypothetical protein [Pseudomonadota bacterium]